MKFWPNVIGWRDVRPSPTHLEVPGLFSLARTAIQRPHELHIEALTRPAQLEPDSGIVRAAMHGFGKPGIIPLWSGEGNLPTPREFCQPVADSLAAGETFYTWQRGLPELREALARYHTRQFGREFSAENFCVTGGGMQAIQTAIQMIAGEGDEIIIPTPAWPNYAGPLRLQGSRPVEVQMEFRNGKWSLDFDRLFAAATDRTRAICLNSPSNPLGWTASQDDLVAIRDFCRKRGIWILGDEVYNRFHYAEQRQPACAIVPRCLRCRGAPHPRQHFLQELGDDGLACRMDTDSKGVGSGR